MTVRTDEANRTIGDRDNNRIASELGRLRIVNKQVPLARTEHEAEKKSRRCAILRLNPCDKKLAVAGCVGGLMLITKLTKPRTELVNVVRRVCNGDAHLPVLRVK